MNGGMLCIDQGLYEAEDGKVYPVAHWFDAHYEECDRAEAIACVAGADDVWFALFLSDFDGGGVQ